MNLAEFIAAHSITVDVEWKSRQLEEDGREVDVWAVSLIVGNLSMDVPFRMGQGLKGRAPNAEDVLECLLSDAAGVANADGFDDWLSEFHADDESLTGAQYKERRATYAAIEQQAEELERLLGDDYETALFGLESN